VPPVIQKLECLKICKFLPFFFVHFFLGSEMLFPFLEVILLIFVQGAAAVVLDSFDANSFTEPRFAPSC
jgi:hypothetical protein